jgi:hypothetical protein
MGIACVGGFSICVRNTRDLHFYTQYAKIAMVVELSDGSSPLFYCPRTRFTQWAYWRIVGRWRSFMLRQLPSLLPLFPPFLALAADFARR